MHFPLIYVPFFSEDVLLEASWSKVIFLELKIISSYSLGQCMETYDKACVYACYILAMCSIQSPNIDCTEKTKQERQKKRIPSPPPPSG